MKFRIEIEVEQGPTPLRPEAKELAAIMHFLAGEIDDHGFQLNEARVASIYGRLTIWRVIPLWEKVK
jgi:hypothetical protein